jgi:hypothetical protein
MITKHIKEPDFELSYQYREYNISNSLTVEYARYKYFNKLNKHLVSVFSGIDNANDNNKPVNFAGTLLLYGIAKNLNLNDPVFIVINEDAINNMLSEHNIQYNNTQITKLIPALNTKITKYIEKIKTNNTLRTLVKQTQGKNIILQINERENTKIPLSKWIYDKLHGRYLERNPNNADQDTNIIDNLIWSALFRYKYLGILDGNQGSVSSKELKYLHENYHVNVELFGSIINTTLKYFCSMFYDLEHYFGSIGNFFNCKLFSGFFEMNPPFIVWIMEASFAHIRTMLENTDDLTVFITIPVWDINDRVILNKHCNTNKKTDYPNPKLDTLKRNKYTIIDRLYCQSGYSYTDYVSSKSNIHFAQTNIIVVSNKYKKNEIGLPFLSRDYVLAAI